MGYLRSINKQGCMYPLFDQLKSMDTELQPSQTLVIKLSYTYFKLWTISFAFEHVIQLRCWPGIALIISSYEEYICHLWHTVLMIWGEDNIFALMTSQLPEGDAPS